MDAGIADVVKVTVKVPPVPVVVVLWVIPSMVTFTVSPDGSRLTYQRRSSCGGTIPRHLTLDPTEHWLLVANQGSDTIAVFARDPQSGQLAETGKTFPISKPQCLIFPLHTT